MVRGEEIGQTMRAGLDQLYERLLTFGYPRAGIDWLKRHRLPVILVLAFVCWALLLALIWGGVWLYQTSVGNLPS
ncbi:hypothetical protein [Devosia sp.]|uniref:hypothetical protein n=1 Tax=Devosia sp. TaxID=1871048 RepID=UPI002FC7570D